MPGGIHSETALNICRTRADWLAIGPHDRVIMAEVVEHLQTPNAASLAKRCNLLAGRNSFMLIPDLPDTSVGAHDFT